jgi:hypothetical protein
MSTQEREAMERLEDNLKGRDVYTCPTELHVDNGIVAQAALSRHARSLQPITVEGLVAMGFEEFHPNCFSNDIVMFWPNYVHENERWRIMKTGRSIPKEAAPQTMLDVDQLIERLSR